MAKRPTIDKGEVDALFSRTDGSKPTGRDEELYSQRYGRPTTFRIPDEIRERFREIADQEGVGVSSLATFVITQFLAAYDAGEIALPKRATHTYTLEY